MAVSPAPAVEAAAKAERPLVADATKAKTKTASTAATAGVQTSTPAPETATTPQNAATTNPANPTAAITAAAAAETAFLPNQPALETLANPPSGVGLGQTAATTTVGGTAATGGLDFASRATMVPETAADQVALAIQKAQSGGRDQISLRLNPAELGRIDVQLEMAEDGLLRASIVAEKAETLELLQRDSSALERALQNAGLKTDAGSLAFDLKNGRQDGGPNSDGDGSGTAENGAERPEAETAEHDFAAGRPSLHQGLLDLSV